MSRFSGFVRCADTKIPRLNSLTPLSSLDPTENKLNFQGSLFRIRQWERYEFVTKIRFFDDLPEHYGGSFSYPLRVIRSEERIVVLAQRKEIARFILTNFFDVSVFNLRPMYFLVDKIVSLALSGHIPQLVTAVHGEIKSSDRSLQKIAFYGSDLLRSTIFKENLDRFNFFAVSLSEVIETGKVAGGKEVEILQIGADGFISCMPIDSRRTRSISLLLADLRKLNILVR